MVAAVLELVVRPLWVWVWVCDVPEGAKLSEDCPCFPLPRPAGALLGGAFVWLYGELGRKVKVALVLGVEVKGNE